MIKRNPGGPVGKKESARKGSLRFEKRPVYESERRAGER